MHVDDLSRNFALNPKNGIKCSVYRRDSPEATSDSELQLLAFYLVHIATSKPINLAINPGSADGSTASADGSAGTTGGEINLIAWDHGNWRETATALRLGSLLTRN